MPSTRTGVQNFPAAVSNNPVWLIFGKRHHLGMAERARVVEGDEAAVVARVHVGASVQQDLDRIPSAVA